MARLFLALWPDDEVRRALTAWRDGWHWPRSASPVHADRLHVTLHFLGEVDDTRSAALAEALRVPFEPFALRFGRNVLWPYGIAVLEPDTVPAPLLALHARLGEALTRHGVALDTRAYKPHVTLARRARTASIASDAPALCWQVERYALMQSEKGYRTLASYTCQQ